MKEKIKERVKEVSDKLEIIELMSKYERFYDKCKLDSLLELFVEDCVVDYGELGQAEGREEMREFLQNYFGKKTEFQDWFHLITNPLVDVDGDKAVGKFHFFGPYIMEDVGAAWLFAYYVINFVRKSEMWKIKTLKFEPKYFTPYEKGWEKDPMGVIK